jgi:hypothetical protein
VGKIAEKLPEKKDSSSIFNITRRHLLHFSSNSTIQSVLDLAGGAGAAFGILSGAFSFVTGTLLGQVSAPSFSPTVMHGSVGLKGSIETNLPMMSFTTQPPGSSHSSSSQNMPYFDCPMGLLTVKNTPKVFVKRWIPFSYEKITYPGRNSQCPVFIQYPYFYSYQLQDNIEVQVNGANGDIMRLVSVEASLVARVRNQEVLGYTSNYYPSQNRSWDLFDIENFGGDTISAVCTYIDNSGTGMVFRQDTNSYALYGRNGTYYFRDVFRQGRYILEGPAVNEADAESSNYYMIRTPFRNISCLKNTSITVPEGSQLAGIKVRAIFERLDGTGKPVIYVATYRTDVQAQAETGAPYPFAPNQITRETVDLGNGMLIAQPPAQATSSLTSANYLFSGLFGSGEYEFSAGRAIELNPGFDSGSSGFEARIENYGCGQDVVSIVPSPCRFPLAPPRRKGRPLPVPAAEQPQAGVELSAFPNPVSETVQFRFSLPEASVVSLNIYNQLMQVSPVLPAARYEEGEHLLSCSMRDLPPGVYFAVFKAGEQVITKKLIRN